MREPLINIAVQAARLAGDLLIRALDRPHNIKVYQLSANSYITDIEQQISQTISRFITKAYPNHGFVNHEQDSFANHNSCWLIDPSVSTSNFINGLPHAGISIAYSYRQRLEHGVIYDPWRQELFTASRGKGAHLNERRIRVGGHKKLVDSILGLGVNKANLGQLNQPSQLLATILPLCHELRQSGAIALDLAYLACGRLDAYCVYGGSLTQLAAGLILIKEAGGLVCDHNSGEHHLSSGNLVAANTTILRQLLIILKNLTTKNC
jgi:myo-inositol-1(or 4)-monophosphatase